MKTISQKYVRGCVIWLIATILTQGASVAVGQQAGQRSSNTVSSPYLRYRGVSGPPAAEFAGQRPPARGPDVPAGWTDDGVDWEEDSYEPEFASTGEAWEEGDWEESDFGSPACCDDPAGCCQSPVACSPCDQRWWVRAEYLLWWTRGFQTPPLVTTSPTGTLQPMAGVLGQPGTQILFGGSNLNSDAQSGGRIDVGYWILPCHQLGIEANYLALGDNDTSFTSQRTTPIIARPFINAETGNEDSSLINFPNLVIGQVGADATSGFQSAEALLRGRLTQRCNYDFDWLLGYRFTRLDDDLVIRDFFLSLDPASGLPAGSTLSSFDQFDTTNKFNGLLVGLDGRFRRSCWTFEVLAKVALGNTRANVLIDGSTTTETGGASATTAGGLLALPSNIGNYTRDWFAVIPELKLTLSAEIACNWRATFGYTIVYWSHVVRPGDQIDRTVNLSQLPPGPLVGPLRPEFSFVSTDFWAQGLNFGLERRF